MLVFPLQNKKVLITKPENSEAFANQIKQLGGIPVVFPLITLKPFQNELLTKTLINNQFDWIVFTSPQAVRFFFLAHNLTQNKVKIAAVGSATKKALEDYSVEVNFIPSIYTAKQLALEIPIEENQHIFIPRSALAKNDIVEVLEQRNSKVTTLAIYQNKAVDYSLQEIRDINRRKIDFITFTSGSAVQSFVKSKLATVNAKIVCIGPETTKIAKDLGLAVSGVANPHNIEGMVNEIIAIASNQATS